VRERGQGDAGTARRGKGMGVRWMGLNKELHQKIQQLYLRVLLVWLKGGGHWSRGRGENAVNGKEKGGGLKELLYLVSRVLMQGKPPI